MGSDLADQSRWERRRFSELLEVKHGFAFLGEYFGDAGTHIVLTPGNFYDAGGFKPKDGKEKWYSGPVPEAYVLDQGAVVVVMTEQSEGLLGSSAIVPTDDLYLHNQRLGLVQIKDESVCDARFTYYLFNTKHVRQQIYASATGTKIRHTSPTRIGQVEVLLPSIEEQRRIADILSAFDDKIETNRRMAATLEEMARATFRAWFVDFLPVRAKASARVEGRDPERAAMAALSGHDEGDLDALPRETLASLAATAALFPDEYAESLLGDIPEGWMPKVIGDCAEVVGGSTPSTSNPAFWDGEIAWATPKDMSRLSAPVLLETERTITSAGLRTIGSGLLPQGAVLLSSRAPIGYLALAETPVAINQGFIAMKPNKGVPPSFLLLWTQANLDEIKSRANGSTFLEISKSNFRPVPVALPPQPLLNAFDIYAAPLFALIASNVREAKTLAATRDALLPKLLSGELA